MESFHGRLRDECLNREQFWTLTEARVVIEDYIHRPNTKAALLILNLFVAGLVAVAGVFSILKVALSGGVF